MSQIAEKKFPCAMLLGGLSVNLNHLKTRVSVLQLQFLKHRNRVNEHSDSVKNLLKEYGSFRKASLNLGVPYKTLHRLCQPPVVRKKETKQVWTDIKKFYTSEVVSHELPSARCKGRHFLTMSLEECFTMYKEGCINEGKNNVAFSISVGLGPKVFLKLGKLQIGSVFVSNVKTLG